jgi:uncharacterized integral membrane protein
MSSDHDSIDDSPTPDELLTALSFNEYESQEKEDRFARKFERDAIGRERDYAELRALSNHYDHKSYWSWFLLGVIGSMILFQMAVIRNIGQGEWRFVGYEWLIPALLVQNLAQVIGLSLFAVKALFASFPHYRDPNTRSRNS